MARKSNDLDKKMIRTGISLIKKHGTSNLSVREVVKVAGVNLGMFSYHFNTKEDFILRALKEIYDGFLVDLESARDGTNKLEKVLFQIAVFSRENREILTAILSDVLSNDRVVTLFLRKNFTKHFTLLSVALDQHLRKKGLVVSNHHHAVRFLVGAVAVPNILLEVYNRNSRKKQQVETDAELKMRISAAVLGLETVLCAKK